MIRIGVTVFVFIPLLLITGCVGTGQPASNNDDWFQKQSERFEKQHADHVKKSSEAVRDYQRYRNQ